MNSKINSFLVVSRFNENVDWIHEFVDNNYVIYNKGTPLPNSFNQIMSENFGANQYDMCRFIHDNYDNLPQSMAFVQGAPFDHCLPDRFRSLIYNTTFTPLFGDKNFPNGIYGEPNDNWYIQPHIYDSPKFSSFDEYAEYIFKDYVHQNYLMFPPGSQIVVEKERCLFYSKNFWKKMMGVFPTTLGTNGGREAHIVERSIQLIFENIFHEREN